MNGINNCMFLGNLGRDAEVRYTQKGDPVCNFSLAINEQWTDTNGLRKEGVEWVSVAIFGKMAETLHPYLVKGKQVFVEGRMTTRKWENKEGQKRQATEIISRRVVLLGGRENGPVDPAHADPAEAPPKAKAGRPRPTPVAPPPPEDDDIPY